MRKLNDVFVNSMWIGKVQRPKLLEAICDLPPEAQIAIHMKFWEKKCDLAISKRLGVPKWLASQIVADGIKKLRGSLGQGRACLRGIAA